MQIKLVGINARFSHSCLALFYVRNEIERYCPEARIELCQLTINDSYYETLLRLSAGEPEYICFSAAVWNSVRVEALIRDLAVCLPACKLLVGGPQASELGRSLEPGLCTVVIGDIEGLGAEFFAAMQAGVLESEYHGSFWSLKKRVLDFPYRANDFGSHLLNRNIYYESSRGCPFACSYCLSAKDRGVFHKELDQVFEELGQILVHQPAVLRFVDRTFNDRPQRALAIWHFLMEQECNTLFHFEIAPDRFSEEMFSFLARVPAGRFQFEIGIQSTNGPTLQAINRTMDSTVAGETVRRLAAMENIFLHVDLILGLPYEDRNAFLRSFSEVFVLGAQYVQMGILKLLPGTPIVSTAADQGYICCDWPPYTVLANRWLDHGALSELYWFCECVERFVNNRYFASFWDYLRSTDEDPADFFLGLLEHSLARNLFGRAPTQELLTDLLSGVVSGRGDAPLLLDLLRHDWLCCGHRFLPPCLAPVGDEKWQKRIRDELYVSLPPEWLGVYDRAGRNHFLKKSMFFRFPAEVLLSLAHVCSGEHGVLAYGPGRDQGLNKRQQVTFLEGSDSWKGAP
ncbi:MAG: DUF4080 domain-containing protein [Desulfobulbaceae bacterium]|uniref:DUF4080 domain-containing protein n=1 Tax=Candidatus Desulfatifera sulfidica TaxID=2841691 RepID=A0A8J6N8A8_9BACT|nr:DUF4080 domain-containing protein [Candidatus Desulfatifera sulfidica]